jgi:hypothetical protein
VILTLASLGVTPAPSSSIDSLIGSHSTPTCHALPSGVPVSLVAYLRVRELGTVRSILTSVTLPATYVLHAVRNAAVAGLLTEVSGG